MFGDLFDGLSSVDVVVTFLACHQRLTLSSRYDLYPEGLFRTPFDLQVLQGSNVVDLDVLGRATQLASIRQEPPLEFRPGSTDF
jgi:hypothetical protein